MARTATRRVRVILAALTVAACAAAAGDHKQHHNPLERLNMAATVHAPDSAIKLVVNASALTQSRGQWVEVSWRGVTHPSYADWVGLLVPAGADPSRTAPAKYALAATDVDKTHLSRGEGRLRFRLINYRAPVQFVFFRGGFVQPQLAARSAPISPAQPNEPLQLRLALTRDNTQMVVQWTTRDVGRPVVRFGTTPGSTRPHGSSSSSAVSPAGGGRPPPPPPQQQQQQQQDAARHTGRSSSKQVRARSSTTYGRDDMCGPPANTVGWLEPGTFHAALLEGLLPGRRYFYAVGDEASGLFSDEASFVAAPPVGPHTRVSIVAVADLGQAEEDGSMESSEMGPSLNTTRRIWQELQAGAGHQLLVHNGDISYARGYVTQWDNFMHQMEPITRSLPYMLIPGNHEHDWPGHDRFGDSEDSGGECGVALQRRFAMPQPAPGKPWYSFDFGPVHFTQYSTEHDFSPGSEQHAWLLADLASVDRSVTPWLVVGGHRPVYICSTNTMPGQGDQPVAQDLRDAFEEAFVEHKVDLTLHGHHHSYQRTCPVIGHKCQAQPHLSSSGSSSSGSSGSKAGGAGGAVYVDAPAPVHLVIGNAGADLSWNVELQPSEVWQTIRMWWGYVRLVADGRQLKCEAVSDLDGKVMDSVTLVKSEGWQGKHAAFMQRWLQQQQHQGGRQPDAGDQPLLAAS